MRQYFTDEEWTILLQAPMEAVMAVCLADNVDPISFLKEIKAGVTIVTEEKTRTDLAGDLAPAVLSAMADIDAVDPLEGDQLILKKQFELLGLMQTFDRPKDARDRAIAHFQQLATLLDNKVTGAQALDFKNWLMSVAQRVAEAQKEGSVMGIGGSRISNRELEVLNRLAATLGISL
ncbi:MAG: hypothetical protein HC929_15925 [Leptolyngbyaceae cyanobacterium SM2_5_2]|nr:hypothetical protein [Leptolyngbyaceae cyanobacterium SM2_5_2]